MTQLGAHTGRTRRSACLHPPPPGPLDGRGQRHFSPGPRGCAPTLCGLHPTRPFLRPSLAVRWLPTFPRGT